MGDLADNPPDDLRKQNKQLAKEVDRLQRELRVATTLRSFHTLIPKWTSPKRRQPRHTAAPVLLISDTHFGEYVDYRSMDGWNAYDDDIAMSRWERVINEIPGMLERHAAGYTFPFMVVALMGDMLSGDIHDELAQTNVYTTPETVTTWVPRIVAGLQALADQTGIERIVVPCVDGNHDRNGKHKTAKRRAESSWTWVIYQWIADRLKDDPRFQFVISRSSSVTVPIFDERFLFVHGDGARGGGGIAGPILPIGRYVHKLDTQHRSMGDPIDHVCMGHWHTVLFGQGFTVNGCFPAGSRVMTSAGYTSIEEVQTGDTVMSRNGTEQKVTATFTKQSDQGLVGLKVKGLPNVLQATPNHLVWAMKGASRSVPPSRRHLICEHRGRPQWIPADFISPGDYVHVPFPSGSETPVSVEDAWAYGLYIAEGNAILDGGSSGKHNRVHLTMHKDERVTVDRWAEWFADRFGVEPKVGHRKGRNTTDLHVSAGRQVSAWFRETFGHGAHHKHLPDGALYWADELKAALVGGWVEGDGHSAAQVNCRPTVSATTVSERLAWEMFHIAPATGSWPSLSKLSAGPSRGSDSYTVHFNVGQDVEVVDGEVFYRVAERYQSSDCVPVFDLEVSGEHTYAVEGVGVHNSLKGYDEWARGMAFGPERAQQVLMLVAPKSGIISRHTVFGDDPHA